MFGRLLAFDHQLVVDTDDAREARNGVLRHRFMRSIRDRAREGDRAVFRLGFNGIVLQVGLEYIRLGGG